MLNGSAEYRTAAAFRRALEDRLKKEAKARGASLEELRRTFIYQRFLALIFAGAPEEWVLKGGGGLLMRLPDARFSKDLDLLHLGDGGSEEAISRLRELTRPREGDFLTFVIGPDVTYSSVNPIVQIDVTAYIGAVYGVFPIDLARELHIIATPEAVDPDPVVEIPGLPGLPSIVVYPISDQVADKVCAMYGVHGERQNVSTRYRDLVDLVLVIGQCEIDAETVLESTSAECRRRGVVLPSRMRPPGPAWEAGYAAMARRAKIDDRLRSLGPALEFVGHCLDPLLSGERSRGRWRPGHGWED